MVYSIAAFFAAAHGKIGQNSGSGPPPHSTRHHPIYKRQLEVGARQLDSVAQLFKALHRNRRAADLIPVREPVVGFFAGASGWI